MKYKISILVLFLVIFLTGCGKKEQSLECSISNKVENGVTISQKYIIKFQNKDFKSAELLKEMKLDDSLSSYLETYKETVEEKLKSDDVTKGLKMEVTDNGTDTIIAKVSFSVEDASKISNTNASNAKYDTMKKALEDIGYVCKSN